MDTAPTALLVIALVALLVVIAFSSGTEVAMLSVNRYRVKHRAAAGQRTARALDALLAKPDDWLGVNLVILAAASVFASQIATILAQRSGYELALPVAGALLTVVMIVFCELAPKIFAALHAERVALSSTYIYRALVAIARPALWLANQLAYGLLRVFGVARSARGGHTLSADELRTVVSETGTVIPQRHRQMLLSILDLERVTVNDIMVPRQDIAGIDLDDDWDDILEQIRQTPHTRLPVYRGELDELVGLLHMKRVAQELARGTLTRFGPLFQIERAGGLFVLAAIEVPEGEFERITAIVNAFPEVAHNYRREHALNMWFVIAAETPAVAWAACDQIEAVTGLPVHAFPKEREYFVGLYLPLLGPSTAAAPAPPPPAAAGALALTEADRELIAATQSGLPLVPRPYDAVAAMLGSSGQAVRTRLAELLAAGVVRRIAAVPNHYRLGYTANGMSVWDVDDARVDELGEKVGALGFVTHCYRRPRALPAWPYNLFAMAHGASREEVAAKADRIAVILGDACHACDILYSTRILKKTGLSLNG